MTDEKNVDCNEGCITRLKEIKRASVAFCTLRTVNTKRNNVEVEYLRISSTQWYQKKGQSYIEVILDRVQILEDLYKSYKNEGVSNIHVIK